MHYSRLLSCSLVALAFTVAACDDDDPVSPDPDPATIRVVNAAQGTANVQVMRSGSTAALATLNFGQTTTSCIEVPAGSQTFTFNAGATELAEVQAQLAAGGNYVLVLSSPGAGTQRRAVLAPGLETATAGNNAIRFINATSTAGDVYVTTPTGTPGGAFLVSGNLSPLAVSNDPLTSFFHRSTEHTRVRLYDAGTTTTARADIALEGLPSSRVATVVFTDVGATAEDRAFLVFPCS